MFLQIRRPHLLLAGTLLMVGSGRAAAAEVRFHYVPVDTNGNTALQPTGPGGSAGVRVRSMGLVQQPFNSQPRPTHMVVFRQPYSGRNITVPVAFPVGTPRLHYSRDRVVWNYGSYTVAAHFQRDGSIDIIYNSGLFRSP